MKYPVYPWTSPDSIPKEADAIQLVRPIKVDLLKQLVEKLSLKEVYLSASCAKRLSSKIKKFLQEKNIQLKQLERRGRAISIGLEKLRQIIEMYRDDKTYREIEAETGVPKSTVHYLVKYADRSKIRLGKNVVYLE